jgi:hypothetical protein
MPAAIGAAVALMIVASALIVAAVNPGLDGRIIAGFASAVIAIVAVGASIAMALLRAMRLPRINDDWTYWWLSRRQRHRRDFRPVTVPEPADLGNRERSWPPPLHVF